MTSIDYRQAVKEDVSQLQELLDYFAENGLILQRKDVEQNYESFWVAHDGEQVVGCCGQRIYENGSQKAEICSLCVREEYQGHGIGSALVGNVLADLETNPDVELIFAFTRAGPMLEKLGFEMTKRERFPEKIMAFCNECPHYSNCDEQAWEYVL
ncbi:MAG: GNAT family N-acetyltransferase [Candidatus Aenigmarchaeota archaeon]|nr:GNAT family N-acetyltransferase [Candidatus Aenigmarchaeota archaeon]